MKGTPSFLYGTAWKEEHTERLTRLAVLSGFRGIDTANQRKHYFEGAVGKALTCLWDEGVCTRQELFLQTKFTFKRGQDHRLPYDPSAPYATQVLQSFESSLHHLRTDHLDSYVLHGPSTNTGLTDADWQVWGAMEHLQRAGKTRYLGVSNVRGSQLSALLANATIKPKFVQNRCFATTGWDLDVRRICAENDVIYQGFSLLTANRLPLKQAPFFAIAWRYEVTVPQVVFAFARSAGMLPLIGTSSEEHMKQDLASLTLTLTVEEQRFIKRCAYTRS
jgi:diketogulonate reductase-like aldo/keto reductase